jgi:hypothetical protein
MRRWPVVDDNDGKWNMQEQCSERKVYLWRSRATAFRTLARSQRTLHLPPSRNTYQYVAQPVQSMTFCETARCWSEHRGHAPRTARNKRAHGARSPSQGQALSRDGSLARGLGNGSCGSNMFFRCRFCSDYCPTMTAVTYSSCVDSLFSSPHSRQYRHSHGYLLNKELTMSH